MLEKWFSRKNLQLVMGVETSLKSVSHIITKTDTMYMKHTTATISETAQSHKLLEHPPATHKRQIRLASLPLEH
jgi:hypothetical protein